MHSDHRLLPWFHLKSVPGIGNHLIKRLIESFGRPEAVFGAAPQELLVVEGVTPQLAERIIRHRVPAAVENELERLERSEFEVLTYSDPDYPRLLREIPDPPPFLYVHGRMPGGIANIAVVGSRHATRYGLDITAQLCADLARRGLTVVSGMAVGIDTAAHEGALLGGGRTIAVLGSGLSRVYPAANRDLFQRIAGHGAVLSEFALQAEPEKHHFPVRNRIISGMSLGVVVAEATKKSGSLITATLALEQNRDVFAVPGSIQSFKSVGTHTLIKQGAKLVENAQDVIEELQAMLDGAQQPEQDPFRPGAPEEPMPVLTADESEVAAALETYPIHIDALLDHVSMDAARLASVLLTLELKGVARQLPGKLFCLAAPTGSG